MQPFQVAEETFVIPHVFPVPLRDQIMVNSLLIRGEEPVIVDTGPPTRSAEWLEAAWSLVDPKAVRWIFLSHDDGDHLGSLDAVLEACPNARLVTGWFATGRLAVDHGRELPVPRCLWANEGDSFTAGDRTLTAVRPPIFDAPTTRGLFDSRTGVYWSSDAFGLFTPGEFENAGDIAADQRWTAFDESAQLISPWVRWVDPTRYGRHIDTIEALGVEVIVGAHGPAFTGSMVGEALRRMRDVPDLPGVDEPNQGHLDQILAVAMQAPGDSAEAVASSQVPAEVG